MLKPEDDELRWLHRGNADHDDKDAVVDVVLRHRFWATSHKESLFWRFSGQYPLLKKFLHVSGDVHLDPRPKCLIIPLEHNPLRLLKKLLLDLFRYRLWHFFRPQECAARGEAVVECAFLQRTCRSISGGTEYPDIGAILLKAAVEAGIPVAVVTIDGAQHQQLSLTLDWRVSRDGLKFHFIFCCHRLLTKHGHFSSGNYGSNFVGFGRVPALRQKTADHRNR
jgi:hypothetical protein